MTTTKKHFFLLPRFPSIHVGYLQPYFSHVNATFEKQDQELCWNSTSTYHPVFWQDQFTSARLSRGASSGGGSLGNVCHFSANVLKRKPHLLQWLFFNRQCVFIPLCELMANKLLIQERLLTIFLMYLAGSVDFFFKFKQKGGYPWKCLLFAVNNPAFFIGLFP